MHPEIIDHEAWERTVSFLEGCKGQKTHIIHDYDVDGISGGLLLLHTLERLGCAVSSSFRAGRGAGMHHGELLRIRDEHAPDRIIITDQDLRSFGHEESFREVFGDTPLLIIDHHFVQQYEDALFAHPETLYGVDGSDYPSAKLVFDLCEAVEEVEDLAWLACLGVLGDAGAQTHRSFLEHVARFEDIDLPEDAYRSAFNEIADAIECCASAREEELQAYVERLKQAPTLAQARSLGNPCGYVREELDRYLARGLTGAETHGPVTFLEIESEFGIAGWVTTLLSFDFPERILIGYRRQVDAVHLSARHQAKRVHLGDIIRSVSRPLGGAGGGHAPAAGGRIPLDRWDAFKERFVAAVQERM